MSEPREYQEFTPAQTPPHYYALFLKDLGIKYEILCTQPIPRGGGDFRAEALRPIRKLDQGATFRPPRCAWARPSGRLAMTVAWCTLGVGITRFVVRKHGNLFVDHGGFTPCEDTIARCFYCSFQPFSSSADVHPLRLSRVVLRATGRIGPVRPPGLAGRCQSKATQSPLPKT